MHAMEIVIVSIVVLFTGGLIYAGLAFFQKKKTREQYLGELAKFVEGKIEPIENGVYENSFRMQFEYEGQQFIYEDIEKQGFKGKVYFAYLKVKTTSTLTLTISAKDQPLKMVSKIFLASEVSAEKIGSSNPFVTLDFLKDCHVYTNNNRMASRFLGDKKISAIFKKMKNLDSARRPFMPIEIVNGMVTLTFSSDPQFHPNLTQLMSDVGSISDHADRLLMIVRKLKEVS